LRITVTAEVPARAVGVDKSVMHIDLFAVDQLTPAAFGAPSTSTCRIQFGKKFGDLLKPVGVGNFAGHLAVNARA
jgi:hypothetical protein